MAPTAPAPPEPPPRPKVIIISIDGLRPDALSAAGAGNILDLAAGGASSYRAQTVMPSITLPSHASMLSGFPVSAHGLTWGEYQPASGLSRVPTIFSAAHAAGLRTAMIVGKEKFRHLNLPGTVDQFLVAGGDADCISQAIIAELGAGTDLLFVHLPQVDLAGHSRGWMSEAYLARVLETDSLVGRLLQAAPAEATVILTADHGGHGTTHGRSIAEDLTIPWIIAGPGIAPGRTLTGRISTTDTGATALHVLGVGLPGGSIGRPVLEAFGAPSAATSYSASRDLSAGGSIALLPRGGSWSKLDRSATDAR